MSIVTAPQRVFADVDSVQGRLRDIDMTLANEIGHVSEEERQEKCRDMIAVGVGVHQQDDFAVAQSGQIELLARPGSDRGHEVGQLNIGKHLIERNALSVENLAAKRENSLRLVVSALFGRTAGRIALYDKEFRFV